MMDVHQTWSSEMPNMTLGAINHGISAAAKGEHPPNLGEFIKHCQTYKPELIETRLERTWSKGEIETNQERLAGLVAMLKGKVTA